MVPARECRRAGPRLYASQPNPEDWGIMGETNVSDTDGGRCWFVCRREAVAPMSGSRSRSRSRSRRKVKVSESDRHQEDGLGIRDIVIPEGHETVIAPVAVTLHPPWEDMAVAPESYRDSNADYSRRHVLSVVHLLYPVVSAFLSISSLCRLNPTSRTSSRQRT